MEYKEMDETLVSEDLTPVPAGTKVGEVLYKKKPHLLTVSADCFTLRNVKTDKEVMSYSFADIIGAIVNEPSIFAILTFERMRKGKQKRVFR
jgi:hypothetical protein